MSMKSEKMTSDDPKCWWTSHHHLCLRVTSENMWREDTEFGNKSNGHETDGFETVLICSVFDHLTLLTSPSKDMYRPTAAPHTSLFPFGMQTPSIRGGGVCMVKGM